MFPSRITLAGLIVSAPLLAAQSTPQVPGKFLLSLNATQVIPAGALLDDGRIGLGTDFQFFKGFGARKLFVGLELRMGGVGPAIHITPRDGAPLAFDQKEHAQNSSTSITIPVRYIFGQGQIRPYVTGSVGAGIWGIKTWNERANESPSLFPTTSHAHLELAEGVGFVALARETSPTWMLDMGLRHVGSGSVDYLFREGFASVNGKTVIETRTISAQVFVFTLGVTALFH